MAVQHINIVYPPGSGGNHLANLISLDKKYSLDISTSVYNDTNTMNVHQSNPRENEKVNIHLYHAGSFIGACRNFQIIPDAINILISYPPNSDLELSCQRIKCWGQIYHNFLFSEFGLFYSPFVIKQILNVNWFTINATELFDKNISKILELFDKINVQVDPAELQDYHDKWLIIIQQYVNSHIANLESKIVYLSKEPT